MKHNIYEATINGVNLRFIHMPDRQAIFLPIDDLLALVKGHITGKLNEIADIVVYGGLNFFADKSDHAGAVIDVDTIGPVIHFLAASNLIHNFGALKNPESNAMRQTVRQMADLHSLYIKQASRASIHFHIDINRFKDMTYEYVARHADLFTIKTQEHNGIWTASCDALGLVTEAGSFEELILNAREIAPQLAELNGLDTDAMKMHLRFEHTEPATYTHANH